MILTADHHLAGEMIKHRVIGTMVSEFHLHGFSATGQRQQLMPETNSEYRELFIQKSLDRIYGCLLYTSPSPRDRG